MHIDLDTLIQLIEDSKVQIEYMSDETYLPMNCDETVITKYMDVIDASKILEQLYNMKERV